MLLFHYSCYITLLILTYAAAIVYADDDERVTIEDIYYATPLRYCWRATLVMPPPYRYALMPLRQPLYTLLPRFFDGWRCYGCQRRYITLLLHMLLILLSAARYDDYIYYYYAVIAAIALITPQQRHADDYADSHLHIFFAAITRHAAIATLRWPLSHITPHAGFAIVR